MKISNCAPRIMLKVSNVTNNDLIYSLLFQNVIILPLYVVRAEVAPRTDDSADGAVWETTEEDELHIGNKLSIEVSTLNIGH